MSIETGHESQSHARQSFIKNEFVIIIVTTNISFQFEIDYSLRRRFLSALLFGEAIKSPTLPHHVHVSLFASPDRLVIKWRRVCYNGKANRNITAYSTPRDIVTGETSSRLNINRWVTLRQVRAYFENEIQITRTFHQRKVISLFPVRKNFSDLVSINDKNSRRRYMNGIPWCHTPSSFSPLMDLHQLLSSWEGCARSRRPHNW